MRGGPSWLSLLALIFHAVALADCFVGAGPGRCPGLITKAQAKVSGAGGDAGQEERVRVEIIAFDR